jgi:hypothetical protein
MNPTGNSAEAWSPSMRTSRFSLLAWIAVAAALSTAAPARGAQQLYLAGDLGISWLSAKGVGTNDIVAITNSGTSEDSTPLYGGELGVLFPMSDALPWRMRLPSFDVPYWPGHAWRFEGSDDVRFPGWQMRAAAEHTRGRNAQLTTPSFNPLDSYRSDVESWTLMGTLRLDIPIRAPIDALYGRVPFLEPFTFYMGGGAGMGDTDVAVSTGLLVGNKEVQQFAWEALAGFGYQLNDRMQLSVGYRYLNLGDFKTELVDSTFLDRGRYRLSVDAHEFNASLTVWFWQLPPLLGEE